jgi:hypothetical protein
MKKGLLQDERENYVFGGISSAISKAVSKKLSKSKVGKKNEFKDTLGSTSASEKLSVDDTEKFFKEHGYKEWNGEPLKNGEQAYEFKLDKYGRPEGLIVYEQVGDKLEKDVFKNPTLRKVATYMGYAEGGVVRNPKAEGGSMDDQMLMVMTPPMESEMESDNDMEDGYTRFIMEEALSEDEEDMLTSKLEQDEQLSMLFDKIIDVAQEFAGSGPVEGPGSGVSDSIPARLSDGEFVFTAKAVEEIGEDSLMSMMKDAEAKADERQGLAEGGMLEEPKTESLLTQSGIVQEDTIAEDELKKRMVQGSSSYVRS